MAQSDSLVSERIDELEARLAQQDQSILELCDEVYQQQQHLAQLEIRFRNLTDRVQALAQPASENDATDETPPHY